MYRVFEVSRTPENKPVVAPVGEVADLTVAILRARRYGGYVVNAADKKLVMQTMLPKGLKYQPALKSVASGEDV